MPQFMEKYLEKQERTRLTLVEFAQDKFLPPLAGDAQPFKQRFVLFEIIDVKFGPELALPRADTDHTDIVIPAESVILPMRQDDAFQSIREENPFGDHGNELFDILLTQEMTVSASRAFAFNSELPAITTPDIRSEVMRVLS